MSVSWVTTCIVHKDWLKGKTNGIILIISKQTKFKRKKNNILTVFKF